MSKKRKRISRRRLAGQRVLAHVPTYNLETGSHKPVTAARRYIAEAALGMLHQALDGFARLDPQQAEQVIRADANVDTEFKSIVRQLITHMMEDPRTITTSIDIIWIARAVERIGDHAKNIAEHVVFIVEGRDIRHPPKEAKA